MIDGAVKRVNNGLSTPDEERAIIGKPNYAGGIGATPRVAANTVQLGQSPGNATLPLTTAQSGKVPTPTPATPVPSRQAEANEPEPEPIAPQKASQAPTITLQQFAALVSNAADRVSAVQVSNYAKQHKAGAEEIDLLVSLVIGSVIDESGNPLFKDTEKYSDDA